MPNSSIKINQALATAIEKLRQAKNKFPHLDAEILLSNILKKPREYILAHPEKQLTKTQITNYKLQITKRAKGKPVAYITKHKQFYGLDFYVNKNVLIPRPETELMVDEALKILKTKDTRCPTCASPLASTRRACASPLASTRRACASPLASTRRVGHRVSWIIIDVGTGSGCIIITLAKKLNLKSKIAPSPKPWSAAPAKVLYGGQVGDLNLKFIATDISKPALTIARKNAKLHNVHKNITFLRGNLLEPIIKSKNFSLLTSHFLLLANLPYLTPAQIKNSPSIKHEPKLALSAGPDGLKYYQQLFKQIKLFKIYDLSRRPARRTRLWQARRSIALATERFKILVEIDPCQIIKIKQLVKRELPRSKIQIKKDLRGHDRLIIINIRNS